MDTGCFVRLEGVPGGREGLVHVSQMASKRVANVKEGGEAGQEVFVKVVSVRS
jgi:ATP-dependent RNA helicase DHX8/PRP22